MAFNVGTLRLQRKIMSREILVSWRLHGESIVVVDLAPSLIFETFYFSEYLEDSLVVSSKGIDVGSTCLD